MSAREALHRLVDDLPEKELPTAARVLEALGGAGDRACHAPLPASPDEFGRRSNGLVRFAGTWSAEEFAELEAAVAATEGDNILDSPGRTC